MTIILEWTGCVFGLLGAFLLATNSKASRYGWWAFLAANIAMIGFAMNMQSYGLVVQQIGFMATSVFGLHRANLLPNYLTVFKGRERER